MPRSIKHAKNQLNLKNYIYLLVEIQDPYMDDSDNESEYYDIDSKFIDAL